MFDLEFWLMFIAAVPAGVGGALLGDRAVAWLLEQWEGRAAATRPVDQPQGRLASDEGPL